MKVYLHIGFEKTGSTSIQAALNSERIALLNEGVLYPEFNTNSNVELYNYAKSLHPLDELRVFNGINSQDKLNEFRARFESKVDTIFRKSNSKVVVLSNENLSARLNSIEDIERLRSLISKYASQIKIIVYIRNIYSFIHSSYSTSVKQGYRGSIPEFVGSGSLNFRYQYTRILSLWSSVFGSENIIVKDYEKISRDGNLVADFMREINFQNNSFSNTKNRNKSLDSVTLYALKEFNAHVPFLKNNSYNRLRGDAVNILESLSDNNDGLYYRDEFLSVKNRVMESYSNVYFKPEQYGLTGDIFKEPTEFSAETISVSEVAKVLSKLWERKQEQYLAIKEEVK